MKTCHVCNSICDDAAELCPLCGADLSISQAETAEDREEKIIENPVLLATLDDVVSAEILRDILNSNGIPNTSGDTEGGSMRVLFGGGFIAEEIYVDKSDFEKADELYNQFLETDTGLEDGFFEDDFDSDEDI